MDHERTQGFTLGSAPAALQAASSASPAHPKTQGFTLGSAPAALQAASRASRSQPKTQGFNPELHLRPSRLRLVHCACNPELKEAEESDAR